MRSPRQSYAILSSTELATASPRTPSSAGRVSRPSYVDRSERVSPLSPPRLTRSAIDRAPLLVRRPDSDSVTSFTACPPPVQPVPETLLTLQSELSPAPVEEMLELDGSEMDDDRDDNDGSETALDLSSRVATASQPQSEPLDYVALRKFFFEEEAAPAPKRIDPPKKVTPPMRASSPFIPPSVRATSPASYEERPVTRRGRVHTPPTDLRLHTEPHGYRILAPAAPVRSYDEPTPVFPVAAPRRSFPEPSPPASVAPESWRESPWMLPSQPSIRAAHPKPFKLELPVVVAAVTGLLAFSVMVAAILFVRSDDARFDAKAQNGLAAAPPAAALESPPVVTDTAPPAMFAAPPARPVMTVAPVAQPAPVASVARKKHQVLFAKSDAPRQDSPRVDFPKADKAEAPKAEVPSRTKAAKKVGGKSVEAILDELGEEQLRR